MPIDAGGLRRLGTALVQLQASGLPPVWLTGR